MSKKVYIGVGHGGKDPGALGNGFKEKDLALDISRACGDYLAAHGVEVMLSRYTDETESLADKIKECNAYAPTLALDIHINAAGGDGAEVFQSKFSTYDDMLARNVYDEILKIGQNGRGIKVRLTKDGKRDYFGFVRDVRCPSILVEPAFIDSKDVQIIDTPAEREAMGIAIAKGVLKTLGINEKPTTPEKPKLSVDEVAKKVLRGDYGNGAERRKRLEAEGYNYDEVQNRVNEIKGNSSASKPPKPAPIEPNDTVIVNGYGNGASSGKGNRTKENYKNKKMRVVKIVKDAKLPYACSVIMDKSNKAVTGYFAAEQVVKKV